MISKPRIVISLGLLLLLFYSLFLKGFFPMKQGLEGLSNKDDAPNVPGMKDNPFPSGKYDRLILLVIDALRDDFVFETQYRMPFLRQLISYKEALGFLAKVHPPTVTLPRIKALTTGGIPGFVDVVLNFGSSSLEEDNIITQLRHAGKELVFYGDDTWMKLFPGHFLRTDGTTSFFVTDYTEVDTNVSRHLPDELTRYDWDVMILHYLGLDHIGHLAGPHSPLVTPKLQEMDGVIHKVYQAMKQWAEESQLRSLVVVCGDHGMSDQGGHGGASPGETTVPVIFINPTFKDSTVPVMTEPEYIMQIDVAPTLSTLLGIPIPKNNLGEIVTETLIGYSVKEKLRVMQLNGHQVAGLLEHNVADIQKEKGYRLYEQTLRRHSDWLNETNMSQELWELLGERLEKDYGKAMREMRSRVSETSTNYDLYMMGISIAGLWLTLFFLLCASVSDTGAFYLSANRITVSLICCIPVVLGHMTICTSQFRSDILCSTSVIVVPVQLIVTVVVVMATLFSVMIVVRWRRHKKESAFHNLIERVLVGGCVLHTLSLLSSSFVEEEHQTWYFFITTLHIILICRLIGHVCPVSQKAEDRGGQSGYRLRDDSQGDYSENVNMYKQRQSENKQRAQTKSEHGERVPMSVSIKSMVAMFVVLALCRVLRRWNQTGDKWISVPDIGDWLFRPEHKNFLSVSVAVSMLCLTVTRWRSASLYHSALSVIAMTTTYCYRAANGVVVLPGLYSGTSKGLLEARVTYCLIAVYLILSVWQWWSHREEPNHSHQEVWRSVQTVWLMLMMLILRPHNSAMVAMVAVVESLVSNHVISSAKLRPAFLTLYCVWMGQAVFFFQGNSNSLTTVDVTAGYVGLDDYRPVLIGLLMFISTYAGPIFWMVSLLKYLNVVPACQDGQSTSILKLSQDHITSAVTLLTSRVLPLAVYSLLVTVERYHLFVWTVFSPKLLYEGNMSLVLCGFAFIHVVCAMHYGKLAGTRKKYDK